MPDSKKRCILRLVISAAAFHIFIVISPLAFACDCACRGTAADSDDIHNCSMWAAISTNIADDEILNQLFIYSNSLRYLSISRNVDGWGIAYYPVPGDSVTLTRGAIRAFYDPEYESTVISLNRAEPDIILAHVRNCSAGCCCHGCDSIPDPHPFIRFKNNIYWSFEHNGTINKPLLFDLIGEEYLLNNPLTGSGIPECDPSDPGMIVDSELYFLLLLKHIESAGWNTIQGILATLKNVLKRSSMESMNFILSDGLNMWTFKKDRPLYYKYAPDDNYSAVATKYPTRYQEDWLEVNDFELIIFTYGSQPLLVPRAYIPGDVNGDRRLLGSDVSYGLHYIRGYGSPPLDSCFNDSSQTWLYAAADANGDCRFNGSDITYLINYFLGRNSIPKWCNQTPPLGAVSDINQDGIDKTKPVFEKH
jgi:predicted glutamine amidotransferase